MTDCKNQTKQAPHDPRERAQLFTRMKRKKATDRSYNFPTAFRPLAHEQRKRTVEVEQWPGRRTVRRGAAICGGGGLWRFFNGQAGARRRSLAWRSPLLGNSFPTQRTQRSNLTHPGERASMIESSPEFLMSSLGFLLIIVFSTVQGFAELGAWLILWLASWQVPLRCCNRAKAASCSAQSVGAKSVCWATTSFLSPFDSPVQCFTEELSELECCHGITPFGSL